MYMPISVSEMMQRIADKDDIYLMVCGESVVFDRNEGLVYVPFSNYDSAVMNPLADFKTHIGHGLLWSRHIELDCSSCAMLSALEAAGFSCEAVPGAADGMIALLSRQTEPGYACTGSKMPAL